MATDPERELARRTRRSFIVLGAGAVVGAAGWALLNMGGEEGDIAPGLRRVLSFNEKTVRGVLYSNSRLAKTYPLSAVGNIKVNGEIGLDDDSELSDWKLALTPYQSARASNLTLADVRSLPRHEEIIDFKCVEGWSTVTQFAGARLSDFTARFAQGSEKAQCVGLKTPDEEYYVSIDMPSALHPQTLLAWEMNGQPLTEEHGAPLRLVTPVKYGIKNIKRIGSIEFTDSRPDDYWAERGYDWYAGL